MAPQRRSRVQQERGGRIGAADELSVHGLSVGQGVEKIGVQDDDRHPEIGTCAVQPTTPARRQDEQIAPGKAMLSRGVRLLDCTVFDHPEEEFPFRIQPLRRRRIPDRKPPRAYCLAVGRLIRRVMAMVAWRVVWYGQRYGLFRIIPISVAPL